MNEFKPVTPLRFWCQKVLPLVYDDSLSYYETLCKIAERLNITIDTLNSILDKINGIDSQIEELVNQKFEEYLASGEIQRIINESIRNNFDSYKKELLDTAMYGNVKNWGAVGDGVTDDTAAILAAYSDNHNLYFPPGTYVITQTINLESNTHLLFDGVIKLNLINSRLTDRTIGKEFLSAYQCAFASSHSSNICISNLTLVGAYNPDWYFQGLQVWEEQSNNQCVLLFNNVNNLEIKNLTLTNYSGTYQGNYTYDDDTYPFDINNPVNPVKFSRCSNLNVDGVLLHNYSAEAIFFFDCENASISNLVCDSTCLPISAFDFWYCNYANINNVSVMSGTTGNGINIYSDNVKLNNVFVGASYSPYHIKWLSTNLDVSNESNVVKWPGFHTAASNCIINNVVGYNAGVVSAWSGSRLGSEKVLTNTTFSNISIFYDDLNKYEVVWSSFYYNIGILFFPNEIDNPTFNNVNIYGNCMALCATETTGSVTINNMNYNSPSPSSLGEFPMIKTSNAIITLRINDSNLNCYYGGYTSGINNIFMKNTNLSLTRSFIFAGNYTIENFELRNCFFESMSPAVSIANDVSGAIFTSSNTLVNNLLIDNCIAKCRTITNSDTSSINSGIHADFAVISNNTFYAPNTGTAVRGFNSFSCYPSGTVYYLNNTLIASDQVKQLVFFTTNLVYIYGNVGVDCTVNTNGSIDGQMAYSAFNLFNAIAIKGGFDALSTSSTFVNDQMLNSLALTDFASTYGTLDLFTSRTTNAAFYPPNRSSQNSNLIFMPKASTVLCVPRNSIASDIQIGIISPTGISWSQLVKTGNVRFESNTLQYYNGSTWVNVPPIT